ncbi:11251_t:CDS:2 [Diversispora eburnea]|uniref:11251_t:CDS:1 n=1 Tax=Diversispora eburnea TaxID=1213867 RepID=A0A9N9FIH1_9GLOM|nr:11251_t:CDS:2 [Diversispora eburnea]
MSARDTQYTYSYTTPKNHQKLHQNAQTSLHHQYTQQQNQFTTTQDSLLGQTTSGTNSQYTSPHNHSIAQNNSGIQPRRFKTSQHTSISSQTSTTPNRQYTTSQHPSIAPPTLDHPNSPLNSTQCLSSPNNVTTMTSLPNSLPTPPTIPVGLSSPSSGTTTVTNFELQDVIAQFQTQPELLKLILTSKVEEDKRRAEEAKLRVRELDLMLSERNRQRKSAEDIKHNGNEQVNNNDMDYDNNGSPTTSQLQLNPQDLLTSSNNQIITSRIHDQEGIRSIENEENNNNTTSNKRRRKRREMLPVTVIIETKESPYVDDYLWKNNGNTTQKKTGNKSVYFKCSNSNKGCPVNKTVTEKEGGWTIKYRGHHLEECGKIKRIVQN